MRLTTTSTTAFILLMCGALLTTACVRTVEERWAPGIPKRSGQLVDGKQQGSWSYFYRTGRQQATGVWKDDFQDGAWTWWFANGQVQSQGTYEQGFKTGVWEQFHQTGAPAASGAWHRDRQTGVWRYGRSDGRLHAVGWFDQGLRHGSWTWFHEDGTLKEHGVYLYGLRAGTWARRPLGGAVVTEDLGVPAGWTLVNEASAEGRWWSAKRPDGALAARELVGADGLPRLALIAVAGGLATQQWGPDGRLVAAGALVDGKADGRWLHVQSGIEYAVPWKAGTPPAEPAFAVAQVADLERLRREAEAPRAAPVPVDPPLAQVNSMTNAAVAVLPAVTAAVPAQTSQPATAPAPDGGPGSAATPELTPVPILPQFWTEAQSGKISDIISFFTRGEAIGGYGEVVPEDKSNRQRQDLIGKPLTQTRFLAPTGSVLDLDDYKGKAVVLVVMRGFSGQVCLYCAAQTAALSNEIAAFRAAKAEVVVVYPGPVESVPAFIQAIQSLRAEPPPMPLALDVSLLAVRALGIEGNLAKPASFVIGPDGIVRYAYVGITIADRPSAAELLREVRRIVK